MTRPWQLLMFDKTLKKRQRLSVLKRLMGPVGDDEDCLLVTCGDNNGAINWHLSRLGGRWSFADLEATCLAEMSQLLGKEVLFVTPDHLRFADGAFDRVVVIDVHEHLRDALAFTREVSRITRTGGHVICTAPNGDDSKPVVRLKNALGMTPDVYGHVRVGLTPQQFEEQLELSGIGNRQTVTFSGFFTELLELSINFAYVKLLAPHSTVRVEKGQIAPATGAQLESVRRSYRLYSLIYPLYWLISRFDKLLPFAEGYVVVVAGIKAES